MSKKGAGTPTMTPIADTPIKAASSAPDKQIPLSPEIEDSSLGSSTERAVGSDAPQHTTSSSLSVSISSCLASLVQPFCGPGRAANTPLSLTDLPSELVEMVLKWAITTDGPLRCIIQLDSVKQEEDQAEQDQEEHASEERLREACIIDEYRWSCPSVPNLRLVSRLFDTMLKAMLVHAEIQVLLNRSQGPDDASEVEQPNYDMRAFDITPGLPDWLRLHATRLHIVSQQICAGFGPLPYISIAHLPGIHSLIISPLDVAYACRCWERRVRFSVNNRRRGVAWSFTSEVRGWATPPPDEFETLCNQHGEVAVMRHILRS